MLTISTNLGEQKKHITPEIEQWPITKFYGDRAKFIDALNEYAFARLVEKNSDLKSLLEKTLYMEKNRVKNKPWKVDPPDDKEYWKGLGIEVASETSAERKEELIEKTIKRIINRYAEEIVGGFQPNTFRFARKTLTVIFKRLFNRIHFPYLIKAWGRKSSLLEKIKVSGSVDDVRTLFGKGTVILVPTHFSNLDSILLGYAIDFKVGIPAFTWGAGLNLFDYEILARYMNRLGTYRVDRRKKNPIYLETLKAMSSLSLHFGLNNIFFPGGTRSRSGQMEQNLKLGLLQSTMEAQRLNLESGNDEKIFIVPVILGYHFVLEAKGLIEQHLKIEGKEKYTRIKRKGSVIKKTWVMVKNILRKETDVRIHFCQPLDVVGNIVNNNGESFDQSGKQVSIKDYFSMDKAVNKDLQREKIYTQLLSNKILETYNKENIILSSHLLAFVAFELFQLLHPNITIYELVIKRQKDLQLDAQLLHEGLAMVIAQLLLREEAGEVTLTEIIHEGATACIHEGLKKLGLFHQDKALFRKNVNTFSSENLKLLYFYHNRLNGFNIEEHLSPMREKLNLIEKTKI